MSTDTLPNTDLSTLVNLDIEPQCGHSQHDVDPLHSGPAKFMVSVKCPMCPSEYLNKIRCKGFTDSFKHPQFFLRCIACDTESKSDYWNPQITPL